jgi:hypothetical protein
LHDRYGKITTEHTGIHLNLQTGLVLFQQKYPATGDRTHLRATLSLPSIVFTPKETGSRSHLPVQTFTCKSKTVADPEIFHWGVSTIKFGLKGEITLNMSYFYFFGKIFCRKKGFPAPEPLSESANARVVNGTTL